MMIRLYYWSIYSIKNYGSMVSSVQTGKMVAKDTKGEKLMENLVKLANEWISNFNDPEALSVIGRVFARES